DRELDRFLQVVGDLGDPDAVLDHDVDVDGQAALDLGDVNSAVDALAPQQLGETVAQAAGRHARDAVAAERRVTGDSGHRRGEDLDPPPFPRVPQGGPGLGHERQMVQFDTANRVPARAAIPQPEGTSWPSAARSAARSRSTDTTSVTRRTGSTGGSCRTSRWAA